ncbi:YceI family protein [uncultured Cytophaga sp.]|uniref:YceI family protein n=1 Tax=uncultured Cytophaga sp. TaxID=160238 RepID=UPI00260C2F50|nr:YceI family protein [uncultured Cytophaga sp.]
MTTTNWVIDASHSEIQFKVKHLVITTVTGAFNDFSGTVEAGDDTFENAKISFEASTASINTNSEQRDTHLKSADFFDIEKFPKLTFSATKFTKKGDDFELVGDLTIKDVTKSITLAVEYGGTAKDPWGNTKAGFEVSGKISRKEFGLTWNTITEAGGALVGDEIKLIANVQLLKQ